MPTVYLLYRILISEAGITRKPTSMSATASEQRKKLVALCSLPSRDTAIMTSIFPAIVKNIITRINRAGQFSTAGVTSNSEKLDLKKLWLMLKESFPRKLFNAAIVVIVC